MADVIFKAKFKTMNKLDADLGQITKVSTSDYEELYNKPILNGETIIGDKTGEDYHLQDKLEFASVHDIEKILYLDI